METAQMSESPVKMEPREGDLADGKRKNTDEVESGDSKRVKIETEETNGNSINKTEVVAASKTEEAEPVPAISAEELDKRIIRQVEHYFGDYNLPKDKFMKEQILLDDGWIPVAILLKFKRLADLTGSPSVILSALAKSTTGLLEIHEADKKVRRSKDKPLVELSDEGHENLKSRSVYCKGFPRQSTTLDKALEFSKPYDTVINIQMRKFPKDGGFKGSLIMTFQECDQAVAFMALEQVKYNDYTIKRQWLKDWEAEKAVEQEVYKERKKKKEEAAKEKAEKGEPETEDAGKVTLPRGTILKLSNLPVGANRDHIKLGFADLPADIAHIEINEEDKTAFIRLRGENDGKLVYGKLEENKSVKVLEETIQVVLLEGEEENDYLTKAEERMDAANKNFKGGRGRGRGRGGRGGGRGRGRGGNRGKGNSKK